MALKTCHCSYPHGRTGRLQSRDKSEDLPDKTVRSKLSGRKAQNHQMIPPSSFPLAEKNSLINDRFNHTEMITGKTRFCTTRILTKIQFFVIGSMLSLVSAGQIKSLSDTVKIGEVIVNGHPSKSAPGNNIAVIDSSLLKDYSHDNISDVLTENTPIFVKSYGSGGIATISLRGTGAGYTQLAWNGVNINSPMLGQTDLSLLPAGFIDEINIHYGGSSLALNSGGIGGIINFETKPQWREETSFLADLSMGSFGRYSGLFKVKSGNRNFQSSTKALIQSARNNFLYLNTFTTNDPVKERRKNAAVYENSFMQEFYFHKDRNVVSARVWYQNANRDIPVPIINQQPENGEKQNDEFLRTMVNYNRYNVTSDYSASLSWFSEKLNYRNPQLSIDSRNNSNTIIFKGGFDKTIKEKTRLSILFNNELSLVNSVNYNGNKSLNLAGITVSLRRKIGLKLGYSALIKETMKDNGFLIPDFSTGLDYRLITGKEQYLKINFSHNSKVPTLNDMYWNPGGNSSLKNEYSFTGELTYEMNSSITPSLSINSQYSFYLISIDNMIKWTPGVSNFWSPENIEKANSSGVEGNVSLLYNTNNLKLRINVRYGWNQAHVVRSTDSESITGKQLIYIPEHQLSTGIRAGYRNLYLFWMTCYTGRRYTSTDNTQSLPGYFLNNLTTGWKVGSGKGDFDFNFKIENLFNVNYQAIAWYPMPGRTFIISLIYKLGIQK
jgi:vitamin B12 transporter